MSAARAVQAATTVYREDSAIAHLVWDEPAYEEPFTGGIRAHTALCGLHPGPGQLWRGGHNLLEAITATGLAICLDCERVRRR